MPERKLVQFGAGNIGRSFIGPLFARAGYEVVFVDIDDVLVQALNERRRYRVEIKDERPETIWVENVRAVHGRDVEQVADELATAGVAATAVGPKALPHLYPVLAQGLLKRRERDGGPLDLILCENLRDAAVQVRAGLAAHLPPDYPLDELVGLVETSIGKMVPLMTAEQRAEDPLLIFAEAYNTLIVDRLGFRCGVPDVPGLDAKENMKAYVDRKLFIHNLGHAVTAYVGHLVNPGWTYVWEAVGHEDVRRAAEGAMWESGRALIAEYPDEFTEANQREHIDDLLRRFGNRALGDTIYRVGRDVPRKLSPQDRLLGALRLDIRHGVAAPYTLLGVAAACLFRATDEKGELFGADRWFVEEVYPRGISAVLQDVCGLEPEEPADQALREAITQVIEFVLRERGAGRDWLAEYLRHHRRILAPDEYERERSNDDS